VSWVSISLIVFGLIFALVGSSLWIGIALAIAGSIGGLLFTNFEVGSAVVMTAFASSNSFILTALPFFVFMGELLFVSRISDRLYAGISPWVSRLPGGLLHSNILACTLFASISGSSAVTTATIGTVAIPELGKRGYDKGMVLGSLAGAGTLGLLIPPSIVMIVYGAMTGNSVGQLFIAGVIPGLLIAALFMTFIGVVASRNREIAPTRGTPSWRDRMASIVLVLPTFFVIGMVLGLIYLGITTPTEAGAIGALCAFLLTLHYRCFTWKALKDSMKETIRISCMIMLIVMGASILSTMVAYLKIPQELARFVASLGLSRYVILGIICIIYLGLGCLFDGISMMVLTLPILYPLVLEMGFDGLWFGVMVVILIEVAQITPPVGFNLYVLKNMSGWPIEKIVRSTIPFFILMLLGVIVVTIFPDIATWLPSIMIRR